MIFFKKASRKVIFLFFLLMISGFLISLYIQTDPHVKQWLMIVVSLFMIELFAISYSLQIRKTLILNFGILPENSDDLFSSIYKTHQKKSWPEWNKVKFSYLLAVSFFISFGIESFLIEFDVLKMNTYFTLIRSTPLSSWLIFFSMIIVSLLFVELIILIYLWIFIKTLNEKNLLR